jgi:hypothetical protein
MYKYKFYNSNKNKYENMNTNNTNNSNAILDNAVYTEQTHDNDNDLEINTPSNTEINTQTNTNNYNNINNYNYIKSNKFNKTTKSNNSYLQKKHFDNFFNNININSNIVQQSDNRNGEANGQANANSNINIISNNVINNIDNNIFCINCGRYGHNFKICDEPVYSYGLICFYKKKTLVKDNSLSNDFFNKRTKKNEITIKSTSNKKHHKHPHNIPNIKILKRHEMISHTLKNMLGIVGNNPNDDTFNENIDGVIDVEEIIDMDGEYDNIPEIEPKMKEVIMEKIIMVQRRNTIGMIEFIRGKYEVSNPEYIIKLFNMLTFDEKRILREHSNFDMIRTLIGLKRDTNHRGEYEDAKRKFNELKNNPSCDMIHSLLDNSYTKWNSPEWGIPKGRRSNKEFDIECAIREFVEETGIKYKNLNVYRNVKPLEEIYRGINGVVYKHVYYLASVKETPDADENITIIERGGQINCEVGNVKLFNLSECHKVIRPYYISKLNVIKKGFQLINCLGNYFE